MKQMFLILSLFYKLIVIQKFIHAADFNELQNTKEWDSFKGQYAKTYLNLEEDQQKMKVYFNNADKIARHNKRFQKGEVSFELGMNHFGDLTAEEFAETYLSKLGSNPNEASKLEDIDPHFIKSLPPNSGKVPDAKNWVDEGAVTDVKNQGKCGCCWAFCVVGAIEGQVFIHTKHLKSYSPQNLLDCVGNRYGRSNTCTSGVMFDAMQYVVDNGGIETDHLYPYKGKQNTCQYNPNNKGATIKDFKLLERGNEKLLKDVVGAIGPVACGFDGKSDYFFQFYRSGIFDSLSCKKAPADLTHSLLVVGYGTSAGHDFWLAKNTWGDQWGEKGYVRLARNSDNVCGIASDCYYPVI